VDSLESAFCGRAFQRRSVTRRLDHSYLPGLLRDTISRNTLQLCNVSRSTTTHGGPFNSCWLAVWLKVHCSRRGVYGLRDDILPASISRRRFPSLSCPYPYPFTVTSIPRSRITKGRKVAFTQRYLNSQLSENLRWSAFTSTASVQISLICTCKARICSSESVLQRCSG
jgi:hypothetical protein